MHRQPRPLARQARRQRAQGMETEEKVWQLYVTGRRQTAIAGQLKMSESRISRYVARRLQRIEENAASNPDELAFMRKQLAVCIWATIAETHLRPDSVSGKGRGPVMAKKMEASAPMLAVRLKAFDQLAKLYGLYKQSQRT